MLSPPFGRGSPVHLAILRLGDLVIDRANRQITRSPDREIGAAEGRKVIRSPRFANQRHRFQWA